eukprot:gene21262-46144_t
MPGKRWGDDPAVVSYLKDHRVARLTRHTEQGNESPKTSCAVCSVRLFCAARAVDDALRRLVELRPPAAAAALQHLQKENTALRLRIAALET